MSRASWEWMPGLEKEIGREAGEWKQEIHQLFFSFGWSSVWGWCLVKTFPQASHKPFWTLVTCLPFPTLVGLDYSCLLRSPWIKWVAKSVDRKQFTGDNVPRCSKQKCRMPDLNCIDKQWMYFRYLNTVCYLATLKQGHKLSVAMMSILLNLQMFHFCPKKTSISLRQKRSDRLES